MKCMVENLRQYGYMPAGEPVLDVQSNWVDHTVDVMVRVYVRRLK